MNYLKRKLFSLVHKLFSDQIWDIEREAVRRTRVTFDAERQEIEKRVSASEREYFNTLIDQKVAQKYSQDNWLVDPNEVFVLSASGIPYLNQEPMKQKDAEVLQFEARQLQDSKLWNVLTNTLRQKAIEKSVLLSENWEQVLTGKAMVHNLSLLKSIIEYIAKIDVNKLSANSGGKETVI